MSRPFITHQGQSDPTDTARPPERAPSTLHLSEEDRAVLTQAIRTERRRLHRARTRINSDTATVFRDLRRLREIEAQLA